MIETVRSFLAYPRVYRLFHDLVGAPKRTRTLVRDYIRPNHGDRVLEIGCGPGTIVPHLPGVEYVGFDASSNYIEEARRRFPEAEFRCERVSQFTLPQRDYFDIVLAIGIVHHLDDEEALQLFRIGRDALAEGGRLITLDPVWTSDQSPAARYLQSRDRGQFIREQTAYLNLAQRVFTRVESNIRHDLLRIPYSGLIMQCAR